VPKLLVSNGKRLSVYDIGEPLMVIEARGCPLKDNGYKIMSNDEARARIRQYLQAGTIEIVKKAKP
jgi:hypothetical protein